MGAPGGITDPYLVLGVPRTASAGEIRAAFRRLAALHHPDRNPDDPGAVTRFKAVNAAHQILGDPDRRRAHDGHAPPVARPSPPRPRDTSPSPPSATPVDASPAVAPPLVDDEPQPRKRKRRRGLFWSPFTAMLLGGALTLAIQKAASFARPRLAEVDGAGAEWGLAELSPLFAALVVASVVYVALSFLGATRRGRRWRRRDPGSPAIHGR